MAWINESSLQMVWCALCPASVRTLDTQLWVQLIWTKKNAGRLEGWPKESKGNCVRWGNIEIIWIVCPNVSRSQSKEEDNSSQVGKRMLWRCSPPLWFTDDSTVSGRRNKSTASSQGISPYATQDLSLVNLSFPNLSFPHKSVIVAPLNGIWKEQGFFLFVCFGFFWGFKFFFLFDFIFLVFFLMFTNQGSSTATLCSPRLHQT